MIKAGCVGARLKSNREFVASLTYSPYAPRLGSFAERRETQCPYVQSCKRLIHIGSGMELLPKGCLLNI